jgi:histidyl-tRNA synthetase
MILNFGLRFDYWFPGKYVDDAVRNPEVVTIPDETRQNKLKLKNMQTRTEELVTEEELIKRLNS